MIRCGGLRAFEGELEIDLDIILEQKFQQEPDECIFDYKVLSRPEWRKGNVFATGCSGIAITTNFSCEACISLSFDENALLELREIQESNTETRDIYESVKDITPSSMILLHEYFPVLIYMTENAIKNSTVTDQSGLRYTAIQKTLGRLVLAKGGRKTVGILTLSKHRYFARFSRYTYATDYTNFSSQSPETIRVYTCKLWKADKSCSRSCTERIDEEWSIYGSGNQLRRDSGKR
jgi:hypothetical protein